MKKTFKNLVLASLVLSAPLAASDDYVKSLVGFEGGYGKLDIEHGTAPLEKTRANATNGGIKIGAESENIRFFLNANYLDGSKFDNALAYGASLQYLLNLGSHVNFFAGPNVGYINVRVLDEDRHASNMKKVYFGADAGFNIHLGESLDLELGGRYLHINEKTAINGVTYELKSHATAFGALIFKFDLAR